MTINKHPLIPHMVRQVPDQFSWIDHRLVRERYIDYLSNSAASLYLFLVTVSDARGLSYYSDKTLLKRLNMDDKSLESARTSLIRLQLIAYRNPLYQVLPLDYRREADNSSSQVQALSSHATGGGQ